MREIRLPCYGVVLRIPASVAGTSEAPSITSSLLRESWHESEEQEERHWRIVGILSLVLAHAVTGLNVTTTAYVAGVEAALSLYA